MPHFSSPSTIVALATPEARSAIGMVRLSGPDARTIVQQLVDKKLPNQSHKACLRQLILPDQTVLDQAVITLFLAPKSYTGEEMVEISCHGSLYVLQTLLHALCAAGAQAAEPGEFSKRAFLHGKIDLPQAEAVHDVIHATHKSAHQLAMNQLNGGLSTQIQYFRTSIIDFAGLIELELDFSEEDVVFANRDLLRAKCAALIHDITPLLSRFHQGNAIRNGIQVAIVGPPNAGKSTLFNSLLGKEQAIVSATAGTTRDYLEATHWLQHTPIQLFDTAGLRETEQTIEKEGIKRTQERVAEAHIVLWVFDLQAYMPADFAEITTAWQAQYAPSVENNQQEWKWVGNKCDTLSENTLSAWQQVPNLLVLSAEANIGMETLKDALSDPLSTQKNDCLISHARHYDLLNHTALALDRVIKGIDQQAGTELLAADLRMGVDALGQIIGTIHSEDILARIFSTFCIGK